MHATADQWRPTRTAVWIVSIRRRLRQAKSHPSLGKVRWSLLRLAPIAAHETDDRFAPFAFGVRLTAGTDDGLQRGRFYGRIRERGLLNFRAMARARLRRRFRRLIDMCRARHMGISWPN